MAVNATAVWRVRPSGNNANGGGYDSGIASPGTDYSQQNGPQVTFDGATILATTSGVSATITITGYTVAASDVANALHITGGTNFTAGWYFVQSVNVGANTWTLDRNVASGAGAAMTGRMGGGWADPVTNMASTGPIVPGNTIYVLGSGVPNPASYTIDYVLPAFVTPTAGTTTAGYITVANDPATPSYGSGGMPVLSASTLAWNNPTQWAFDGIWLVATGASALIPFNSTPGSTVVRNCVADQSGWDSTIWGNAWLYEFNEWFSSVAKRSTNANAAVVVSADFNPTMTGCNIHDCIGPGLSLGRTGTCIGTIVAENGGNGVNLGVNSLQGYACTLMNCTIDANAGDGVNLSGQTQVQVAHIVNNIISNHTGVGKFGINAAAGTAAANDRVKSLMDYNVFYNNTADLNALSYGANDTHGGSDPYAGQSTENYALAAALYNKGFPLAAFPQHKSGQTNTVRSYVSPGAVQPSPSGPVSGGLMVGQAASRAAFW